jgi:hypothetical protein
MIKSLIRGAQMFTEKDRKILLTGSEKEIKELIMNLSSPASQGYTVGINFLTFKYNEKLIKKTHGLVMATWVLAIINVLLVFISFRK